MSTASSTLAAAPDPSLFIAVISPDRQRRIAASSAVAQCGNVQTRDFEADGATIEEFRNLLGRSFDGVLIDLDGDPQRALALVEGLCVDSPILVTVFSSRSDPELMMRAMRAGAREFFTTPIQNDAIARALVWIAAHRRQPAPAKIAAGRLHIFLGSKGGVGVTTLATNFAVALDSQSKQSTLLIDLNLLLGDAALNLGIHASRSVADALENSVHLDANLLATFLARHSSGLSVLAAPVQMSNDLPSPADIGRMLAVARRQFDNIVIDAGKKIDLHQMHLYIPAATVYLVTQVGIPELRNANRLIAQFTGEDGPKLEIVINRYQSRFLGLTDEHLNKALTRPVRWKVPNDFKAVTAMQSTGTPLVNYDTPIAAVLRKMAEAASSNPAFSESAPSNSPGWLRLRSAGTPATVPAHSVAAVAQQSSHISSGAFTR